MVAELDMAEDFNLKGALHFGLSGWSVLVLLHLGGRAGGHSLAASLNYCKE
jgi:hypothetical protein